MYIGAFINFFVTFIMLFTVPIQLDFSMMNFYDDELLR